jgi:hypothetical protein
MIPFGKKFGAIVALCALPFVAAALEAQNATSFPETERLIVADGAPLRVVVAGKVRFKLNQPVHARLVEPVFAFDREVLAAGTEVEGHIAGFKSAPRLDRITALLGGNFTPLREPILSFDSLVLKDGKSIPIQTSVTPGTDTVVRFGAGPQGEKQQKKGKVATATESAKQQIGSRKRTVIDAIKAPGKMDRVKEAMWSFAPWHPQYLPSASRFNAKLQSPISFGEVSIPSSELSQLGSQPAPDSIVAARLVPALDSRTASHGTEVEAIITWPMFSEDNHLMFPEGSRLMGTVVQAQPARHWHHNGKLAFMFTRMQLPASLAGSDVPATREVEGRLNGVEVNAREAPIEIDEEGGAAAASSKKRFIMPAITTLLAMNGADDHEAVRVHHIKTGAYRNNYAGRLISGGIGFGLIGSAMGRLLGPIAPALGFYGAGRTIYSNVIGPGQEVTFPADTPIEIRLSAGAAQKQ